MVTAGDRSYCRTRDGHPPLFRGKSLLRRPTLDTRRLRQRMGVARVGCGCRQPTRVSGVSGVLLPAIGGASRLTRGRDWSAPGCAYLRRG
jgi:hypothetical protein